MPPTPSTPTVAVPAAINVTSFLRSCCAGLRRERCVNVPGAGGGVPGLPGVADHQAKGSTPAIESPRLPPGGGNVSFAGTIFVGPSGCTNQQVERFRYVRTHCVNRGNGLLYTLQRSVKGIRPAKRQRSTE